MWQRGFHGVSRAQLLGLLHPVYVSRGKLLLHLLLAMPNHHMDGLRGKGLRGLDNVREHGFSADGVQHFGLAGIHARAFACGEDDDV